MNANKVITDLNARYMDEPTDAWFRSATSDTDRPKKPLDADPAYLLERLRQDLDSIHVPTSESIRILRWIYEKSRGFCRARYSSLEEYADVCMAKTWEKHFALDPETIPIYLIDGLPGYGKTSIVKALARTQPPPGYSFAEGFPPQKIATMSTLCIRMNKNFSLNDFARDTLLSLGVSPPKEAKSFYALSSLLYKTLYRVGATTLIVDELQFASGKVSANKVISQLLALRELGLPIFAFTNTDLVHLIDDAPCQVSQRIGRLRETVRPLCRGSAEFLDVISAQFSLLPFGHTLVLADDALDLYDMVSGSQRAIARLLEIASEKCMLERRPLTMNDLIDASNSPSFSSLAAQINLLNSVLPIDEKKRAELASKNSDHDPAAVLRKQLDQQRLEDAASVALFGAWSTSEREAALAASTKILRDAGRLPENVTSIGEAKRKRRTTRKISEQVSESFVTRHLAKAMEPKRPKKSDKKP